MSLKAPVAPTTDLDRALHDMDEHGYALIADVLDAATIEAMKARFAEQAIAEAKLHGRTLSMDDEMMRVDMGGMLNKGKIWQVMLNTESLSYQLIDRVLAPTVDAHLAEMHGLEQRFILSTYDATFKRREALSVGNTNEGRSALMFHTDQAFMPWHTECPVSVNTFTALTDYTYDNGATMVLPGTHKQPPPLWGEFDGSGAIPIEAPAGCSIVIDARLWHAGGVNTNGELRASVNLLYLAPWLRQRWPAALNLRQEVIDDLTDHQLRLLGFDTMFQSEYGSYVGPNIIEPLLGRNNVTFKAEAVGELHLA